MIYNSFFFFSSRRRHTRFDCDWSSDVCSSDLLQRVLQAMPVQQCGDLCFQLRRVPMRVVAEVEIHFELAGNHVVGTGAGVDVGDLQAGRREALVRSEEHTSELQSQSNLVCRLLLEKKKQRTSTNM